MCTLKLCTLCIFFQQLVTVAGFFSAGARRGERRWGRSENASASAENRRFVSAPSANWIWNWNWKRNSNRNRNGRSNSRRNSSGGAEEQEQETRSEALGFTQWSKAAPFVFVIFSSSVYIFTSLAPPNKRKSWHKNVSAGASECVRDTDTDTDTMRYTGGRKRVQCSGQRWWIVFSKKIMLLS